MNTSEIIIAGDTAGVDWRLPVLHFKGGDPAAPKVYIQAALHANELPGTALVHFLCEKLRQSESAGQIRSDIIVVPHANPIGAAQSHFGELQGRFDLASRTNFNREFPLISVKDRDGLLENLERLSAVDKLKRQLLHMALGCDLVIDLHCDDESLQYAYIDEAFWPEAADLASAMEMEAVLLSDGESSAFEEAVGFAWKCETSEKQSRLPGKLSVTVELRGRRDVYPDMAKKDAEGLWKFLASRGAIDVTVSLPAFDGPAVPLDNIEMVRAPEACTVLFHRNIGEWVGEGDVLATLITRPGMADGSVEIRAPQAGLIVMRSSQRLVRRGADMMKIACKTASKATRKPGTLEN
jgi:predicted deacylase